MVDIPQSACSQTPARTIFQIIKKIQILLLYSKKTEGDEDN